MPVYLDEHTVVRKLRVNNLSERFFKGLCRGRIVLWRTRTERLFHNSCAKTMISVLLGRGKTFVWPLVLLHF